MKVRTEVGVVGHAAGRASIGTGRVLARAASRTVSLIRRNLAVAVAASDVASGIQLLEVGGAYDLASAWYGQRHG